VTRRFLWVCLLAAPAGCAELAEAVVDSLIDEGIHAACGESSQERRDRKERERYRRHWSTPGRTPEEIEGEARADFQRKDGREPNLNWHAR
jgi:hypothetical protein